MFEKMYNDWLSQVHLVDSSPFYKSRGCTSEQVTRFLKLCTLFHVPLWYMQDLCYEGTNLYRIDHFADEPIISLLGLAYSDNVVLTETGIEGVIDFIKAVPNIMFNSVAMTEELKQKYGKYFTMVETCVVQSPNIESYLESFPSKKRYSLRKANSLRLSEGFKNNTQIYDINYNKSSLDEYMLDTTLTSIIERLLTKTSHKYWFRDVYHAQSSLLWALSIGGTLVYNNSPEGEAGQLLVKRDNYWFNGFFTSTSSNPLYLKAFLLECLDRTLWSDGCIYYTTSHGTAYDIFEADDSSYGAYKSQIADSKRPCGLIASIATLDDKPEYLDPPYYVIDTKTWVFE
jgi:hypothetical protein